MTPEPVPITQDPDPHHPFPDQLRERIISWFSRNLTTETERYWTTRVEASQKVVDQETLLAAVTDPNILKLRLDFDFMAIAAQAAKILSEHLENKKQHAVKSIHLSVEELDHFDPTWTWSYDLAHDHIVRRQEVNNQGVVDHALAMATMDQDALHEIARGSVPSEWKLATAPEWYQDLAELLIEHGEEAVKLIQTTCTDPAAAAEAQTASDLPRPVSHLAAASLSASESTSQEKV